MIDKSITDPQPNLSVANTRTEEIFGIIKEREKNPGPIDNIKDTLGFVTSGDNTSSNKFPGDFETKNVKIAV